MYVDIYIDIIRILYTTTKNLLIQKVFDFQRNYNRFLPSPLFISFFIYFLYNYIYTYTSGQSIKSRAYFPNKNR